MDFKEFADLVPLLVAEKLEDATSPIPVTPEPIPSWSFRFGQVLTVAAMFPASNELRLTLGLAINIPYTPEVFQYVNRLNSKELVFGRAFLVGYGELGRGALLMQEIIFGDSLSWDFPPSVQNLLRIMGTLSGQAMRLAAELFTHYGARPLNDDEAFFLQANG